MPAEDRQQQPSALETREPAPAHEDLPPSYDDVIKGNVPLLVEASHDPAAESNRDDRIQWSKYKKMVILNAVEIMLMIPCSSWYQRQNFWLESLYVYH